MNRREMATKQAEVNILTRNFMAKDTILKEPTLLNR